jgi:hypothetical protein
VFEDTHTHTHSFKVFRRTIHNDCRMSSTAPTLPSTRQVSIAPSILNATHHVADDDDDVNTNKKNLPFNTELLASVLLGVAGGGTPVKAAVVKQLLSVYVPPGTNFSTSFIQAVRKRAQRLIADKAINQAISHALKHPDHFGVSVCVCVCVCVSVCVCVLA